MDAPITQAPHAHCSKFIPQCQGLANVLLKRAATVELDWDVRQKNRFDASDSQGRHLSVFFAGRHHSAWRRGAAG